MDLSQVKTLVHRRARRKRVGRGMGSGKGQTCGRGDKGARSRSGWSARGRTGGQMPISRRLPKVGFSNMPFKKQFSVVNVGQLCRFPGSAHVTPESMREEGLLKQIKESGVKVLGVGELDRPLTVRAHAFSETAREKIESSGGNVEVIPEPKKPVRNKMRPRRPAVG